MYVFGMNSSPKRTLLDNLNTFDNITKKPEKYLEVQNDVADTIKHIVKSLYDFTKVEENSLSNKCDALSELIINDFDEEQIWQELELQNDGICNRLITDVALLVARKDTLRFPVKLKGYSIYNRDEEEEKNSDCHIKSRNVNDSNEPIDSDDNDSDNNDIEEFAVRNDEDGNKNHKQITDRYKSKSSIVDDQFFKLRDLEQFLNNEDRKESHHQKSNSLSVNNIEASDTDSDSESIDYFEASEDSGEEAEEGNTLNYADFFDAPDVVGQRKQGRKRKKEEDEDLEEEEEIEEEERQEKEINSGSKRVGFNIPEDSDGNSSVSDNPNKAKTASVKSSFESRQERLKSRIDHLEEEALGEKPWQLKGEVSAASRPQNSLLEEIVEFDLTTRPAPVITEKTTLKLEDIIRQRVKDWAWDDVQRKVKPVQTPTEYKKTLVMDQEKSKQSLAEVYEKEYIKQREAQMPGGEEQPEEEPPEHQEVRTMMTSLFLKLDALSNFHYTPKMAAPDIKVISNLPAISMEEVAPVATSDATLLAPEEVKAKPKGDVIGKDERTSTDKKRERRHKKAMQRHRQKEKEQRTKTVEKFHPGLGNKYSKERAVQMLEKVTKDKNVSQVEDRGAAKGVRSSTAFFARLQEEVTSHIKLKTQNFKSKRKENISAKRVKL